MSETETKNKTSSKSSTNKSVFSMIKSFSSQEKLIGTLTGGLVVAAFFMGFFYGQLTVLKNGTDGFVAGAQAPSGQAQPEAPAPDTGPISADMWEKILTDPAAVRGSENAEVTIVEFTDYQCPFCARHFSETDGQIKAEYIDTGKVRHITRDLPLPFHGNANIAAQAARCAGDQNAYWEMHDVLFENQDEWGSGNPEELFSGYASEIGINVGSFDSCISSEKYKAAVDADLALAQEVGATGTPSFFINRQKVVGAQPFSAFESVIEEELNN